MARYNSKDNAVVLLYTDLIRLDYELLTTNRIGHGVTIKVFNKECKYYLVIEDNVDGEELLIPSTKEQSNFLIRRYKE